MDLSFARSLKPSLEMVKPLDPIGADPKTSGGGNEFQAILSGAIDNVKSTRQDADQQISSWMSGEQTDIHQVATSIQKASLTFEVALEVRNKMMQAYQEVMRMQI